jgi:hypothetical protein
MVNKPNRYRPRSLNNESKRSEQLKTEKEPLPYDEWKKKLKIQKPKDPIYQIGNHYITLNEVLEMYEDYYFSF